MAQAKEKEEQNIKAITLSTTTFTFAERLRPVHRAILGFVTGSIIFVLIPRELALLLKLLISWTGFCITYLICCWAVFYSMPIKEIKTKANKEDGSRVYVFALILIAAFGSLLAVLMLIIDKTETPQSLLVPVSIGGILLSWSLVHTVYVFHYAHLYYKQGKTADGLNFPGNEEPDYIDFAYFSFVLGCTFQVSDVEITSKQIRRVALFHGLLSFLLNTFVVALTINIVAGLSN